MMVVEKQSLRVLVIEDDLAQQKLLRAMLERVGHRVVAEVARGDDIRLKDETLLADVDVAVVDLTLPGATGPDVIRGLLDRRPDLPALVLSASSHSAAITEALLAGALGYVVKGARMNEIVDAIDLVAKKKPVLSPQVQSELKKRSIVEPSGSVDAAIQRVKRFL